MKKARILVAAIAVFAVIGGSLAFKAQRGAVVYCTMDLGETGTTLTNWTTTNVPGITTYCTTLPNTPITTTTLITPRQ